MPERLVDIVSTGQHRVRTALATELLARGRHAGFIGGEVEPDSGGQDLSLVDPATGAQIGIAAVADRDVIDRAVRAARAALDGPWAALSPLRRGRILARLGDLIEEHAEALVELEVVCTGKPRREAESFDVPQSAEHFLYYGGWPGKLGGETFDVPHEDALVYTLRQPIGVVAAVVPWNFPLLLASWKLAPALAAGCTAVLKPSEQTPLTALLLAELAAEAGFPPGVLNVICGDGTTGAQLTSHKGIDKVAFTGSTAVGRELIRASAESIKPLSLELGGNAPLVVFADSDLDAAAASVVAGSFYNAGQVCVSAARLYVESAGFDELVAEVARRADALAIGPGLDPATQLGPLASRAHASRVDAYVDGVAAEGGELRSCGAPPGGLPPDGFYRAPAVVVGLDDQATATREEVFGPVLVAQPFDDLNDVVRRANATPYGLAAGIFSADLARAHRLAARIRAGTVWINTYQVSDSAVPAGGVKQSGYGRDRGRRALEGFLEEKIVWADLGGPISRSAQ